MAKISFEDVKTKNKIYQFRIDIKGAKPPIWRRVQVEKNITFHQLHAVVQNVFNWLNYHLHEFEINEKVRLVDMNHDSYEDMSDMPTFLGIPQPKEYNEHDIKLNKYIKRVGDIVKYNYDFGDDWEHSIKLEKILDLDLKKQYPMLITGKKVAPFEDCGGIWDWSNLCKIMEGKKVDIDKEYIEELLEYHSKFDPSDFGKEDIEDINENFKKYRYNLFFEETI